MYHRAISCVTIWRYRFFAFKSCRKSLALIRIDREFLSVDVKNDVVHCFPIGELIWEKEINKSKCVSELFIRSR